MWRGRRGEPHLDGVRNGFREMLGGGGGGNIIYAKAHDIKKQVSRGCEALEPSSIVAANVKLLWRPV